MAKNSNYNARLNWWCHYENLCFEIDVIDTCGAGDVFHGAYLARLVKGWDLRRIATFASAVSAIHCTVLGNRKGIPSMEGVEAFLREHR